MSKDKIGMNDLTVHPNVIIRRKIKSKSKLGAMLLEIHDEIIAGIYPSMQHSERLKRFGLHKYTWDDAFGEITYTENRRNEVRVSAQLRDHIMWCQDVVNRYKSMTDLERQIVEAVTLAIIRE